MSISRRSVTTASYLLLARMIGLVANIAVVLIVTRYLGKENFGAYTFVVAYSLFIGTLATGGTFSILIRETAWDLTRAGENLGFALQVQAAFTVLAALLSVVALPIFTRDPLTTNAVYLSVAASIVQVVANLYTSLFTAFEDTLYTAISVFIERGVFLAGVIAVVVLDWGFLSIFWVQLLSFSVKFVFCALVTRLKFARIAWRCDRARLAYFFRESLPLMFSTGFRTLDAQLDTFLLQLLQTAAELGLYGAPYRLISRLNILPDSIMAGLLPALSNLVRDPQGRATALKLYARLFKYFLVLSVPISILVSLWGRPLVTVLFGAEYSEGADALTIMVWTLVFMFLSYLFKYLLTAVGKQQWETVSLIASLVVHGGLSLWLIPQRGAAGAAIAMVVSQAVAFVVGYAYISRSIGAYYPLDVAWKLAVGAVPAVLLAQFWPQGHLAVKLSLAALSYGVALIVLRVVEPDEVRLIVGALRSRGRPAE